LEDSLVVSYCSY